MRHELSEMMEQAAKAISRDLGQAVAEITEQDAVALADQYEAMMLERLRKEAEDHT